MKYTKEEKEKYKNELKIYREEMKKGEWETKPYNEFLSIVTNTENSLVQHEPHATCPYCKSNNIDESDHSQTLVGSFGKYDTNHHWVRCVCNDCKENFTMEYKGQKEGYNIWYTKDSFILSGLPTCFERYIYTCKCGGQVTYKDIKNGLYTIPSKPETRFLFKCNKCLTEILSHTDYYRNYNIHKPFKPHKPLKWVIHEEIGTVVYNSALIDRISFE